MESESITDKAKTAPRSAEASSGSSTSASTVSGPGSQSAGVYPFEKSSKTCLCPNALCRMAMDPSMEVSRVVTLVTWQRSSDNKSDHQSKMSDIALALQSLDKSDTKHVGADKAGKQEDVAAGQGKTCRIDIIGKAKSPQCVLGTLDCNSRVHTASGDAPSVGMALMKSL